MSPPPKPSKHARLALMRDAYEAMVEVQTKCGLLGIRWTMTSVSWSNTLGHSLAAAHIAVWDLSTPIPAHGYVELSTILWHRVKTPELRRHFMIHELCHVLADAQQVRSGINVADCEAHGPHWTAAMIAMGEEPLSTWEPGKHVNVDGLKRF